MLGILWTVAYVFIVIVLSIYGGHRLWTVFLYLRNRGARMEPLKRFSDLPFVTVQLPVYNERYVVERLIRSVANMDYPRDRFQIQVLDDSTDATTEIARESVADLKDQGYDIELIHRTDRRGFKAGALEAALQSARGSYIAIFDADFLPPKNLLREAIHFFTDSSVGMIQTRWGHLNRNYSILTRIQALLLDGHLLIEQTVRSRTGRFFNFNGTAGIWRKEAIRDAGGWQHDTLTEDLDLSYRAQMKGWKFVFLPHLVTPAELPVDMTAFKTQQHRWAKGAVQTCKKLLPTLWRTRLPFKVKIEATFHLTSNFAYLFLLLMALLIRPDPAYGGFEWTSFLAFHLPVFTMSSLSIAIFYGVVLCEIGVKPWKMLFYMPSLFALGIGLSINNAKAVMEALLNRSSSFARTPKYGIGNRSQSGWKEKTYVSSRSLMPLIELLLSCYYVFIVYLAWCYRMWLSLPFLFLFLIGFGYVAYLSLFQRGWGMRGEAVFKKVAESSK